ncbi:MAG: hypothetical protein QGF68_10785 [Nitrospinota bacterium]|nr:hypothetical protein [Nitrospinota bacterium]
MRRFSTAVLSGKNGAGLDERLLTGLCAKGGGCGPPMPALNQEVFKGGTGRSTWWRLVRQGRSCACTLREIL